MPPRAIALPVAAGHVFQMGIAGDARRAPASAAGSLRGSARVEAGLVGQDDQRVGFDQVGDQRGQRVVVAEPDFVGGHGVVLVDDRDDTQVEQRAQRRARIQIALAVGKIFVREQDLRRHAARGCGSRTRRPAPGPSGRRRPRPAVRAARAAGASSPGAACLRRSRRWRPERPAGRRCADARSAPPSRSAQHDPARALRW